MKLSQKSLLDMFRLHSGDELLLCYQGDFKDMLTAHILEISRQNSVLQGDDKKIGKRLSLLLVECFQNIIRHGGNDQMNTLDHSDNFFCLRKVEGIYYLNTANLISKDASPALVSLLKKINTLDNDSLKREYLSRLEHAVINNRGGAGLGLLEMARKSGRKILHELTSFDENNNLVHLQITIEDGGGTTAAERSWIEECHALFKTMKSENSSLKYKGEISQQILIQFLEMSKGFFVKSAAKSKAMKRMTHTLIELLQNISKHAKLHEKGSEGYMIIGQKHKQFIIEAGNVASEKKIAVLSDKLKYLSQLSLRELMELHRKVLAASLKFENKLNSGLGLIEIFMATKSKISYHITRTNDTPFFAISVVI
ncbi:MAG: SiaB family protein kinase [Flavobacteriales bacterium]|nr:SiaB family protein kinase [Flavobacteriales bacterium]